MKLFNYYVVFINVVGLFICIYDKWASKNKLRRISERMLFLVSFLGGCFGFGCGMYMVRHKTRKWYFKYLIPLIGVLWLVIIYKVGVIYG